MQPGEDLMGRIICEEKMSISLVLPLFNESRIIKELYEKVVNILNKMKYQYEIIFIDDGSTDASFRILEELYNQDKRIKVIRFRKNFGKSAALYCGFQQAKGEMIITMDSDLQDEPQEIPKLVSKIEEGYDMVSTWRVKRADPIFKRLLSRLFNRITAFITGIRLHDFNSGLKAYKREVAQELKLYGELHRFIPILTYWKGARISEVEVIHHPRKYGKSKYGTERLWRGAWSFLTILFLTKYANSPLYLLSFHSEVQLR